MKDGACLDQRLPRVLARRGALPELDAVGGGEKVGERDFARELEALLAQTPHGFERRPFQDRIARRALEEALQGVRELGVEVARVVAEVLRGGREPREREAQLLAGRECGRRGLGGGGLAPPARNEPGDEHRDESDSGPERDPVGCGPRGDPHRLVRLRRELLGFLAGRETRCHRQLQIRRADVEPRPEEDSSNV